MKRIRCSCLKKRKKRKKKKATIKTRTPFFILLTKLSKECVALSAGKVGIIARSSGFPEIRHVAKSSKKNAKSLFSPTVHHQSSQSSLQLDVDRDSVVLLDSYGVFGAPCLDALECGLGSDHRESPSGEDMVRMICRMLDAMWIHT